MLRLRALGFVHRELASFVFQTLATMSLLCSDTNPPGFRNLLVVPHYRLFVIVLSIAEVHGCMTRGRSMQGSPESTSRGKLPLRNLRPKRASSVCSPSCSRTVLDPLRLLSSPCLSSSIAGFTEASVDSSPWISIPVEDGYLRLDLTLFGAQSFRWRDLGLVFWRGEEYREFAGVVKRAIVVLRQQADEKPLHAPEQIWYRIEKSLEEPEALHGALVDYFRADMDLRRIIDHFAKRDARFRVLFPYFRGARLLRQDPVESLFAFICSSNNNMKRITGMVMYLAERYGRPIGTYKAIEFYAFPTVENLAACANEEDLRGAGFGYRAKYIVKSAAKLRDLGGESYLLSLREKSREDVASALVNLEGIGRKVAGCIALTSLDCCDEIPCDTHVWQIAKRDYLPHLRSKTLTDRIYTEIGDYFRELFGEYAGLAHNYLFVADLSEYRDRLPPISKPAVDSLDESTVKHSKGSTEAVSAKSSATKRRRIRSKSSAGYGIDD